MKKTELMNSASRAFHKFGFGFKKHSPEILVITGVVGVVASAVMACKATTKVNDILEDTKDQVEKIHMVLDGEISVKEEYTEEDSKKDLAIIYTQTAVKLVKLYAPAVILGTLSITGILASNNILRKRNVALAAAYATVDRSFKDYRGRVVERFGEALDKELRYNIKAKEIEVTEVDNDGVEHTEKKIINVVDAGNFNTHSEYARIFDELNPNWSKDAEFNLMFVHRQQDYANEMLKSQGYLFLNDVYKMLGFLPTRAGQAVGWLYDPKNPDLDNFVDFGLYDIFNCKPIDAECKSAFVNGYERSVILDFNVEDIMHGFNNL